MKDRFKFQFSHGEEKKNFDFADPDVDQVSQIFHDMFGESFGPNKPELPVGCVRCQSCEGTGRVVKVKKHLLGTSKTVTKELCPHCGGKGYIPQNTNEEVTP